MLFGTIIDERKYWESKYIQNLANDLKEYGNSYSFRKLKYMSQFAHELSSSEIRQQPVAQITWGTIINERKYCVLNITKNYLMI